jgi:hypothetical protein
MARGKYQLTAAHYFPGDIYIDSGMVVGDDTPYPVEGPPSFNMMPLDPVAQAEWEAANVVAKGKPEMPASALNPTGNNPSQGPRAQTGTISGPGGVHGPRGLAEPPRPVTSVEMAKAMAVQAAMIPPEEMDRAIEQERARLADLEAEKAMRADRAAAIEKEKSAAKVEVTKVESKPVPPTPPEPARPAVKF